MNETAKKRQSLPDLVIQECGGLEATMETARDNDLSPTDDLEAGESLTFSQRVDAQSTAYYATNTLRPATAITTDEINALTGDGEGVEYWYIEYDFTVS